MGRNKKYLTDEDKKIAKRESRMRSYWANADRERAKNLRRYHEKKAGIWEAAKPVRSIEKKEEPITTPKITTFPLREKAPSIPKAPHSYEEDELHVEEDNPDDY